MRTASRIAVVLTLGIGGCAVGPDYRTPAIDVPARWSEATAPEAPVAADWWKGFHDETLDRLVDKALGANLDVQAAGERLLQARAESRIAFGSLLPGVGTNASYERRQTSGDATGNSTISGIDGNLFDAGFDAAWELDLFGGRRRALEATRADVDAAEYERGDVMVSVAAEIARDYIELRGYQRQADVARRLVAAERDAGEVTKARAAGGLASGFDSVRADALVQQASADIPVFEAAASAALHRLGVLVGEAPGALAAELAPRPGPGPAAPSALPSLLPSELLRRRPDLRAAERRLAAATARVGVATAELYPKFSLVGAAALQSVSSSDFFRADSLAWSVGPTISWPILRGGQIVATIDVRESEARQALIAYRSTILVAFEEVENALVAYDRECERRRSLAEASASSEQAVAIANELYRRGMSDFLAVVDAERTLFRAELDLAHSDAAVAANLVALHKALGGGWSDGQAS